MTRFTVALLALALLTSCGDSVTLEKSSTTTRTAEVLDFSISTTEKLKEGLKIGHLLQVSLFKGGDLDVRIKDAKPRQGKDDLAGSQDYGATFAEAAKVMEHWLDHGDEYAVKPDGGMEYVINLDLRAPTGTSTSVRVPVSKENADKFQRGILDLVEKHLK
jgi:hypothetical protein